MMPMTASVITSGAIVFDACGNSGNDQRRKPNVPTLSITPTRRIDAPMGASAAASGSHVWNGHSGALMANAMKKPNHSHS